MSDSPTEIVYQGERLPVLVLRAAVISVASGPDRGSSCALRHQRVRVGGAPDNDLTLNDPRASRHHLEFQIRDRGYLVRDLQSTNGTFYRGARVGEVLVGQGAEIRVGDTVLRVDRGEETSELIGARRDFGSLVGSASAMQQLYGMLAAVAPTDTSVLIEGETGTGKELVAEEIHRHSPRRGRSFCVVDCGALPRDLIESELFGHEKGAFTGAISDRVGVFERARGGTVFLDEIGELPLELQTRLLRVLDRRTIKRVGSSFQRVVDFRLVAATHRDLEQERREGRFRQDLYFRLAVVRIRLPGLRERREDIPRLARFFLWQAGCADVDAVLNEELLRVLSSRAWPGNVRELRNVVERATILIDGAEPWEPELPAAPSPPGPALDTGKKQSDDGAGSTLVFPGAYMEMDYKTAKDLVLDQFEVQYLARLLERQGSNISAIAREAGIDRHLVRNLLRKHQLGG